MRFKGTIILFLVAAVGGAYFFLVEQPKHRRALREETAETKLADISGDSVARIVIAQPGKPAIEFEKRNESWRLVAPVEDGADAATVNTLITSIADAEIERRIAPEPALLDEFGLTGTATHLALMTAAGDTIFTLIVGDHTLTKSHFYAMRKARSAVLLLPATIRRYAVKDLTDFRDRRVVDFTLTDVTKYRLSSDERSITWELLPDRGWFTIQDGDTIRGDAQAVEAIIQTLRGLRVRSFVSDNPADFEQYWQPPHEEITIWLAGKPEPVKLRCGQAALGEFYAKRDDADRVIKLDGIFLASFDKTVGDLRDKRLLSFSPAAVATIIIQSPDSSGSIVRSGGSWAFPNPALGAIDENAVTRLLDQLQSLGFDAVVPGGSFRPDRHGFGDPSYRIELLDERGERIDRVLAGASADGSARRYITSDSTGLLALIDQQKLQTILETFKRIAAQ